MPNRWEGLRTWANESRYALAGRRRSRGLYESYFQRGNHPTEPRAFWIRYTVFVPKGEPQGAVGELWAIYFDACDRLAAPKVLAHKQQLSMNKCSLSTEVLDVSIGESRLDGNSLVGSINTDGVANVSWELSYTSPEAPLLLLPRLLYRGPFPKARALVGSPNAVFKGTLHVAGEPQIIDDWVGSQNHNWGEKHTDEYAWGQVAGFDEAPDAFLECSTARVRLGARPSPWMTLVVLRFGGKEYRLNSIAQAIRSSGKFSWFEWTIEAKERGVSIRIHMSADRSAFVGLKYANPPGGHKTCLNTKIARCRVDVMTRDGNRHVLRTEHRAAFEILTDRTDHQVPVPPLPPD